MVGEVCFRQHRRQGEASFRPFVKMLQRENVKPAQEDLDVTHKLAAEEEATGKIEENPALKNNSCSSNSDSCETEDTEYLQLERPRNIEVDSKLFNLLRIIKDSKFESAEWEESKQANDKEVEDITRNNSVETLEMRTPDTQSSDDRIFTMTEVERNPGMDLYKELDRLMDDSVEELSDIMHKFESIEEEEMKLSPSNFEPLDKFELIEVTSKPRPRGNIPDNSIVVTGEEKKTSFSSDVHLIVLQDGVCERDRNENELWVKNETIPYKVDDALTDSNTFRCPEHMNDVLTTENLAFCGQGTCEEGKSDDTGKDNEKPTKYDESNMQQKCQKIPSSKTTVVNFIEYF